MSSLRDVKDDLLKAWLYFRNEKYFRNGFCDGIGLISGSTK